MAKKQRKPRKGFTRSKKQWEESIAGHIGKFIDNMKGDDLLNLFAAGVCAFGGYSAAKRLGGNETAALGGAATSVVAFQLAKSMNIIAGGAGIGFLAGVGVIDVYDPLKAVVEKEVVVPVKKEIIDQWRLWGGWLPIWCKEGSALQEWLFPHE